MPQPAQHPPQPARVHTARIVVDDHLHAIADAPRRERSHEGIDRRQRVAPALARLDRAGEILVQVGIDGAGNVRGQIVAAPLGWIGQGKAAVDDGPIRIVDVGRNFGRR
ncbi:MAG: hypothetical protein M9936_26900 [Caldilinea sp.]|nr:hypothetical protein [Caldilinea sp.]